jgi:DNA helicase HerA-like ATPase
MTPNILICGSTRSGKSMAELRRLVEAAEGGASLVVIDPHQNSLSSKLLEHLTARGLQRRIIFR